VINESEINQFYTFKFNYSKTMMRNDAVLLQKDNKFLFMLVGKKVEPNFSKMESNIENLLDIEDLDNELYVGY